MILRRRLRESLINNLLLNATDLAPYKLHFSRDKSLVSQLCLRCYVRQNRQVNKNDIGYFQALASFRRSVVKRSAEEHDAIGVEE